jgi:8-oxo-dGTP diphosphatase
VATPGYVLDLRRSYGQGRLLLVGVSGVVVRNDLEPGRSQILLVRRADNGKWSLPAGIVEPDEQPATTIVRELFEETRVRARADRLTLLTTDPELAYPNGDRCQYVSLTFRCSYLGGEAEVGDEESTEVAWFPTDQLPPELPRLHRRRIATALADHDACVFDA